MNQSLTPEEVIHWLNRCPVSNADECEKCPYHYNDECGELLHDAALLLKAAYSKKEEFE